MGTNYYLLKAPCASCGHGGDPLHIGKSSAGWVFALRVYPLNSDYVNTWGLAIDDLADWLPLFEKHEIRDEYDQIITPQDMKRIITERSHSNGLQRWEPEPGRVLGHGDGTWDRHVGWFS